MFREEEEQRQQRCEDILLKSHGFRYRITIKVQIIKSHSEPTHRPTGAFWIDTNF